MVKFLAILNLAAGGASIAGLYLALHLGHGSFALSVIFAVALVGAAYVLFVPGNKLERNLRSKVENYESRGHPGRLVIQRGEVEIDTSGDQAIEFHEPFAERPNVELIFKSGSRAVEPKVWVVTEHQATFRPKAISWPAQRALFTWVARGNPLPKKKLS
jgi:hypothetical protein